MLHQYDKRTSQINFNAGRIGRVTRFQRRDAYKSQQLAAIRHYMIRLQTTRVLKLGKLALT